MVKIGIIGCGKIAEKHVGAYLRLDNVEITVSDINSSSAKKLGREFNVNWSGDPDSIILSDEYDAIDVCTPTLSHLEIITKALKNGKNVFCEKPMVNSLREAEEIQKVANKVNKMVMVGYLYRFHPAFKLVKEILDERVIGEPYFSMVRLGGRGSHRIWKHQKDRGGGAINEMLMHMLDLIIWYFGDFKETKNLLTEVVLKEREVEGKKIVADAEDLVLLELNTASGARVLCESDLITPSYMNFIEIQGTNGSVWTSILDYFPTVVYCKESRGVYNKGNNFFKFPRVNLFEEELRFFVEKINNKEKVTLNSIEDSVKIMKIVDSLKKGGNIES